MRYRSSLSLAILVVAACSAGVDGPVAVETGSAVFAGVKPPPPIGSSDVEIDLFSPSSETPFEEGLVLGGPSAASFENQPFNSQVHGRYFSNSPLTNGWIEFVSDDNCVASPNAKLQYNEKTGKTSGHGTLTCNGVTLDLSKIEITSGGFGGCELNYGDYSCRSFSFSYDGIAGGNVFVGPGD